MKTATLKCNLPQFEQPLHTAATSSPSLWPLNLIHIIIIVFACSSWQHLLGALLSSAAFSLAISFSCRCLSPSRFSFPPFARLAHLNVFSWHLHRHSIRLISFSCHSQWVDESLGCLLLDSYSSPCPQPQLPPALWQLLCAGKIWQLMRFSNYFQLECWLICLSCSDSQGLKHFICGSFEYWFN